MLKNVVTRPANADDWTQLWPLLQEMGVKLDEVDARTHFYRIVNDPTHLLVVTSLENHLLGYAWAQNYGPHLRAGFATARLYDLLFHEAHRRLGVGTILLEYVKTWVKQEGVIYLQWQSSRKSAGFYDARGLEAIIDPDPSILFLRSNSVSLTISTAFWFSSCLRPPFSNQLNPHDGFQGQ